MVNAVLIAIQVHLASLILILFILLHAGRGGGLSDMFGGVGGGRWPVRPWSSATSTG